jgi:four helix bundle protein
MRYVTPLSMIRSYRDLIVWQKGTALVYETYRLTRAFPADERFVLVPQMRRAAIAVPADIAEGQGRNSYRAEYRRFLSMSRGSLKELETYFVLSEGLGYATSRDLEPAWSLCDEISRMLTSMQQALRQGKRR